MIEEWKPITGYEELYEISNLGNIRSIPKQTLIKGGIDNKGYKRIYFTKNGKRVVGFFHRIVLAEFFGKSDKMANHINRDRSDNRLSNLEYVSPRENVNHFQKSKYLTGARPANTKNERWQSMISINGKRTHLGMFATELEAHQAYLNKVKELGDDKYVRKLGVTT